MECRIEENILWVSGKLDSSTSPEFEAAIAKLAESLVQLPPQAVLEFSGIETLTSAPLRAMLTLAKRLHASKGSVVLAAPSPVAVEALKVSGFMRLQVFQVISSVADLKKAAQPQPQPQPQPRQQPQKQPQLQPQPPSQPPPAAAPEKPPRPEPARTQVVSAAPKPAPAPKKTSAAPRPISVASEKEEAQPGLFQRFWKAIAFWRR